MTEEKRTFIDKLYALDRRVIYVFVFLGVLLPFIFPFYLPVNVTKNTLSIYDKIEEIAAKPEGGSILMSFDFDPSSEAELTPMSLAILRHIFRHKGKLRLVGMGNWPTGISLAENILQRAAVESDAKYVEDYVFLGYKAGGFSLSINMGQDFFSAFPKDTKGTSVKTMLPTKNITKLADFDFVLSMSAGSGGIDDWVIYGQTKYKFAMAGGCTAVMGPDFFPYLQTGQLIGLMSGLVGAAEYETKIGVPGKASAGMNSQSIVHVILILFIIFGNVMYFVKKRHAPQVEEN